jgi:hypothetical protein
MDRDSAREWTRYRSTDERAKERKKSQMQAATRRYHRPSA